MQSPPAEWALGIGYLVILDLIRAHGDADKDTLSEVIRDTVARHPRGRPLFAIAVAAGALGFYRHIDRPLRMTH